ncbi:RecX family transcriptional regulator [Sphingomonas sp. HDW15A]|uniref:regulatory protein RecX n=1 Tax=Sphingomonas sp. HDW15A TaxID=2714942 RepID=UPI0014088D53|nr:RecX family transcriptional regulator [Sphingomonas sp. HDW15A]QIK96452.1 RecX family transcriptional regulator [Sphingomonas sp. HDW15A]
MARRVAALPDAGGVWHKHGVTSSRRPRPPLDRRDLDELALRYVARFATSRAKLRSYLLRKIRERGWTGDEDPPLDQIADRLSELGYVDDQAYATSLSQSLGSRGYGHRRVAGAISAAGISESDAAEALEFAEQRAAEAALRFAKKRNIGPFSAASADRPKREKWIAAMIRAGHSFALAQRIADSEPGVIPEEWLIFE